MVKIALTPGSWRSPAPRTWLPRSDAAVIILAGDTLGIGLDHDGKPVVRNFTAERRAKVDEAVRLATKRVWPGWEHPEANFLGAAAIEPDKHAPFLAKFASAVRRAWRDIDAQWERA